MYKKLREKKAFTLVEIMIVVAIIGLLVAIAVPNFVKARRTTRANLCMNNMRLIGHAAEQYLVDENLNDAGDITDISALDVYIKGGLPGCPQDPDGAAYTTGAGTDGGVLVTCAVNTDHGDYDTSAPSD